MSRRRGRGRPPEPERQPESAPEAAPDEPIADAAQPEPPSPPDPEPEARPSDDEVQVIDVMRDDLVLGRAQIDAGLLGLAEGTVRRRLARLEADGVTADDETDALRLLLAETMWRQGRPSAARRAFESIRPASPQRRLPIALLVEAETLAAAGEGDRAAGAQERLLAAVGPEAAFELSAGVAGRLTWPLPEAMQPGAGRAPRPPWTARADGDPGDVEPPDDERVAAGRGRLEEARVAYVAGDLARGDAEMSIAVRLDPALAADGVGLIEPTLGTQPSPDRLLLYGDLLNAAGRETEATRAYDLAADRRSGTTST